MYRRSPTRVRALPQPMAALNVIIIIHDKMDIKTAYSSRSARRIFCIKMTENRTGTPTRRRQPGLKLLQT